MKIWAATRDENKILRDRIFDFPAAKPRTLEEWSALLGEVCSELDLARPVLLKKHINDLNAFRHTAFLPADFMESVDFHKFTIELFPEKKKEHAKA